MAGILGKLKGIIASASEPSRNGRKYTENFWDNIFNSDLFKEGLKNKVMLGELWHPDDDKEYSQIHANPTRTAVVLTEVNKKGLDYYGTFEILPTLAGETLKNLYDIGCVFGVSSRGYNDYDTDVFNDPSTFELITFDIVAFPGIKSARLYPVAAVAESFGRKRINKTKVMENLNTISSKDKQAKEFINNTMKIKESFDDELEQKLVDTWFSREDAELLVQLYPSLAEDLAYNDTLGLEDYIEAQAWLDKKKAAGAKIEEDFDEEIQADELIPDDLRDYAYIIKINKNGVPIYDDGVHGEKPVSYNMSDDFVFTPGNEYLVDDIYFKDDAYVPIGNWLQIK